MRASANGSSPAALAARSDVAQRMLNPAQTQRPRPHPSPDEGEDTRHTGRSRRADPELRMGPNKRLAENGADHKGGTVAAPLGVEEGEKEERREERRGGEDANVPKFHLQGTENRN